MADIVFKLRNLCVASLSLLHFTQNKHHAFKTCYVLCVYNAFDLGEVLLESV